MLQLLDPFERISGLRLLAALIAGELCSIYATFVAHTIVPVSHRFVENDPGLKALYGRYQEIYNWDGLTFTLMASFAVFVLVWCTLRAIAILWDSRTNVTAATEELANVYCIRANQGWQRRALCLAVQAA
ncbi:MAG TPA: hypothetical protein VMI10_10300 [Terriglobales bacterium]|nr:hypothetical protein [Terriglobales bacterium]